MTRAGSAFCGNRSSVPAIHNIVRGGRQVTLEIPTGDFDHELLPPALAILSRLRAPPPPA